MATLSLDFSPVSRTGSAKVPKPLTAVGQVFFEGPYSFVASQYYYSNRSAVFRGDILADIPDARSQEVVCKYREEDILELEREAHFYQHNLRELQGALVPRFYGLYKGSRIDEDGKQWTVVCIIFEHFPADRSVPYWERPLETRSVTFHLRRHVTDKLLLQRGHRIWHVRHSFRRDQAQRLRR